MHNPRRNKDLGTIARKGTLQKPGETRVYPSMLAEKEVPVLVLTNSTITSEADLQTAFHSLNLCSMEKEDPSHGRKQSSTEEDTH